MRDVLEQKVHQAMFQYIGIFKLTNVADFLVNSNIYLIITTEEEQKLNYTFKKISETETEVRATCNFVYSIGTPSNPIENIKNLGQMTFAYRVNLNGKVSLREIEFENDVLRNLFLDSYHGDVFCPDREGEIINYFADPVTYQQENTGYKNILTVRQTAGTQLSRDRWRNTLIVLGVALVIGIAVAVSFATFGAGAIPAALVTTFGTKLAASLIMGASAFAAVPVLGLIGGGIYSAVRMFKDWKSQRNLKRKMDSSSARLPDSSPRPVSSAAAPGTPRGTPSVTHAAGRCSGSPVPGATGPAGSDAAPDSSSAASPPSSVPPRPGPGSSNPQQRSRPDSPRRRGSNP